MSSWGECGGAAGSSSVVRGPSTRKVRPPHPRFSGPRPSRPSRRWGKRVRSRTASGRRTSGGTRPARTQLYLTFGRSITLDAATPWTPIQTTAPRRSQTRQPRRRPPGSSGSCGPPVVFQSVPAPPGAAAATTHLVRVGKFEVVKVHLADLLGEERPGMPRPHVHLPAEGDVRPRPSSGGPPRRGERTGRSPAAPRTPGGYRRRASCRGAPLPCTRAPGRAPRGTACTPCGG